MSTHALLSIISAIETATTLDELLLLTLNECAQLLNIAQAAIIMLSEDSTSSRILSTYPPRVTLPDPIALDDTAYLQQVITTRQSVQLYDVRAMQDSSPYIDFFKEYGARSLLFVPLVAQDQVTGVLAMATVAEPRTFSTMEVSLARILTGQLSAAITSFCTTDAAQRRSAELATLNDIASAVTSSLDTREIYHLVVEKLNEYFRVEAGSLLMRNDETGELEFVMTLEGGEEKLAGFKVPRGQGVVGHVAETQRYAIVHSPEDDPRFYSKISEEIGYTTRSILCVPMVVKRRTIGVIELLNKNDGEFTEEDANRLMRMAATIGVALENARLFQQVATGRDRLEAILNSNNDGILMADMHDLVVTANPKAAQFLLKTQDTLLGQKLSTLLNELRARAHEVSVPSWLNDTMTSEIVELELTAPPLYLRQLNLPVRDAQATVIGQLTLLQDISKERELAQLRDDYTGMLVHDLRAPLTAIMNGIMMVRRGLGGTVTAQQDELLGIAYHSSQTMLEMVSTLLDISKMEQGRMPLNPEPASPYAMIEETLDRLRASAEGHQVALRSQLPENLPILEADPEKIVRVLQNLVDNAIKYSPTGGEVTIGVAHIHTDGRGALLDNHRHPLDPATISVSLAKVGAGEWLLLWIRDQGPGIPQQYHERIFEKFGQVRGRKVRGTGLGLTFSKLAVESHGGSIWLESVEGEGTTFALTLPVTLSYHEG